MTYNKYKQYKIADNQLNVPLLKKKTDTEIETFLNKYKLVDIPTPLETLKQTRFYWMEKKKKQTVELVVDHDLKIPKNLVTKYIGKKTEYVNCLYFLGIIGEAVKELEQQLDDLKLKVKNS
tara:strand:+ start:63 stop:425 length:363 start_codon:yes stop_codon:yes gene_type:complete